MQRLLKFGVACCVGWLVAGSVVASVPAAEPIGLHVETLTVPPSTQPLLFVAVQNRQDQTYQGVLTIKGPDGWRLAPASRPLTLAPQETKRVPFTIEQGRNVEANRYAFEVTATGLGTPVTQHLQTFVASAPYHAVTVDGRADEWSDAIPVTFTTQGQRTVVSTYWNRRKLAISLAVQEAKLVSYPGPDAPGAFDAVQLALAPLPTADGPPTASPARRFEYLLVAAGDAARCFRLAPTASPPANGEPTRSLEPLAVPDVEVAVRRVGDITYWECAVPFRLLQDEIRPSEGAEFFLALLVHDPDGTGVRDLADAAGVSPPSHNAPVWSRWPGASWGESPPRYRAVRWGLCTSKY